MDYRSDAVSEVNDLGERVDNAGFAVGADDGHHSDLVVEKSCEGF